MDTKYKPLELTVGGETLVLQNLMRLGGGARKVVMDSLKVIEGVQNAEEATPEDSLNMSNAIEAILENVTAAGKGKTLTDALAGDLVLSLDILEKWTVATQAPEAPTSSD